MAYDEYIADRMRRIFKEINVEVSEKKMMGGLIFKMDGKMLCWINIDKKLGDTLLMARIGPKAYETEILKEETLSTDHTGRTIKGYIFVTADGIDMEEDLKYWIEKCVEFNPEAKASKKKKGKS